MFKFGKKKKDAEAAETGTDVAVATEGAEGEGEAAPKKKKLPLFVLIGAAAVLVLGGGGAAAFFLFMQPSSAEEAPADHAPEEKKEGGGHGGGGEEAADPAVVGTIREGPDGVTFLTLPDMVVNIQSADGRPTFLKLTLTLEMHDAELAHHLQAESPRVNDLLQTFLRELRPEDLAGSAGSYQLRQEILRRVNLVAAPEEIDAVLIEEMLIQ
jgi:flagellar FliL protein